MQSEEAIYLFCYNPNEVSRKELINLFEKKTSKIVDWRTDFPGAFYLASESTVDEIKQFVEHNASLERYFVLKLSRNQIDGRLPKGSWVFLDEEDPSSIEQVEIKA